MKASSTLGPNRIVELESIRRARDEEFWNVWRRVAISDETDIFPSLVPIYDLDNGSVSMVLMIVVYLMQNLVIVC